MCLSGAISVIELPGLVALDWLVLDSLGLRFLSPRGSWQPHAWPSNWRKRKFCGSFEQRQNSVAWMQECCWKKRRCALSTVENKSPIFKIYKIFPASSEWLFVQYLAEAREFRATYLCVVQSRLSAYHGRQQRNWSCNRSDGSIALPKIYFPDDPRGLSRWSLTRNNQLCCAYDLYNPVPCIFPRHIRSPFLVLNSREKMMQQSFCEPRKLLLRLLSRKRVISLKFLQFRTFFLTSPKLCKKDVKQPARQESHTWNPAWDPGESRDGLLRV